MSRELASAGWKQMRDGRFVREHGGGFRVEAEQRVGESDEAFYGRLRWGRFDELMVAFVADRAGVIPAGTLRQYRSDYNAVLREAIGCVWLVDCDDAAHGRLVDAVVDSYGAHRLDATERTLGAVITWALDRNLWPSGVAPFGGREARSARKRSKKAASAVGLDATKSLISLEDCPTWDETCAYAEALADAAEAVCGASARVIGELPKLQYVTGSRIATAFAMHASGLLTARGTFHSVFQWDRSKSYSGGGQPPLILEKNKRADGRYPQIWDWALPWVEEFFGRAVRERDGWAFATALPGCVRPLDRVERLMREVRSEVGYRWTSHWHRHAYASVNLASCEEGGYGRSVATVAAWLGDGIEITQKTYWHGASRPESGWSLRRPPRRRV